MSREADLEHARKLFEQREFKECYSVCNRHLEDNPEDFQALTIIANVMMENQNNGVAYNITKRITQLSPQDPGVWMNFGIACVNLWRMVEARKAYDRGLSLAKNDKQKSQFCLNISGLLVDVGRFSDAEVYCKQALELNPESKKGRANLGFCQLAQRNFREGWANYRYALGTKERAQHNYCGEPMWDGKGRGVIAVTCEQGIGDMISFASMVPDMIEWAKANDSKVVIDCERRLEGIMRRSFPEATVYPTLMRETIEWDEKPDYSIAMGQLGEYFRPRESDFPGTPYLVPDPDRVLQWKALFESKKKPVIGIAWRGGIPRTGARFRQWDLEQLLPILKSVDAHWVSLQYKPAHKEIAEFRKNHRKIDLVEYPHGTLTSDYDDTIAMVAAMDHLVTMQTAVNHVAGGLGIPAWVHVPANSQWRYGEEGEDFVWASSVRIIRQERNGEWKPIIQRTADELAREFPGANRKRGHRKKRNKASNGLQVRSNSKSQGLASAP
jgi:tetratricopeptide (TPR) repeat protein